MASKNKEEKVRNNVFSKISNYIQGNMDNLYKQTYYSDPTNKNQLQDIKSDITASIKDIMDNNYNNIGEPNISKFFERIFSDQNDKDTVQAFSDIFGDNDFINNLTGSYLDNRWVKMYDDEIDQVIRYMPKLQEALSTIKDNVLSSDSFSKEYLHLDTSTPTSNNNKEEFDRNIKLLKDNYKLDDLVDEIYDSASKYGECFTYIVPYQKAIENLLRKKNSPSTSSFTVKTEGANVLIESSDLSFETKTIKIPDKIDGDDSNIDINMNITFNEGYIESIIESEYELRGIYNKVKNTSLTEQFFNENSIIKEDNKTFNNTIDDEPLEDKKLPTHNNFDHTLYDDMPISDFEDTTADGLYDTQKANIRINSMNGAIIKNIERDKIIPIILNDSEICLGYYYFEFDNDVFDENYKSTELINTITGRATGTGTIYDNITRRDELLKNISSNIASKIDAQFINRNQDLKKEIYYILKYNDAYNQLSGTTNNIRISYIPPEDIHHTYFKLNKKTGRGISDLELSLIPAKLWVAIYITNCLAVMTRGNDKRVYYVKQTVEQNISKTLIKTINEIKKSNFGIRQIENLNTILNITGRFNDYIVPRSSDGQSPIDFEIVPGQQVEIKTDLLNLLEESAINVTGVPIEIIQNRQSPDYALQLTMSNSKFLRFVYKRQSVFQDILNSLITKIYDLEYCTSEKIEVMLPPPLFINVTNTNQLIVNVIEYCDNILNVVMADEQDDTLRAKVGKELKQYYLGTYLDMDVITAIIDKAKQSRVEDGVSNPENMEEQ